MPFKKSKGTALKKMNKNLIILILFLWLYNGAIFEEKPPMEDKKTDLF